MRVSSEYRRGSIQTLPFSLSLRLHRCPSGAQTVINTMCGFGVQTMSHLEANKSIYAAGCMDKAAMWIESHLLLVGALALGTALPQVTPLTALLNSAHAHTYNSPLPLVTADNSGPRKCLWRRRNNTQYTHQYWEATGDSLELSL